MKIEIERSGGFAGIVRKITIDTENLPKDMIDIIEKNLSKTKLTNRLSSDSKRRVPDCYYYKISTEERKSIHKIEFGEFDIDNELRRIINSLFKKYPESEN